MSSTPIASWPRDASRARYCTSGAPSTFPTFWPTPNTPCGAAQQIGVRSHHARRPADARGDADRRNHPDRDGAAAVHRQADRAGHDLRRPGGDRHRERAAVRRGAGAHARAQRIAGAADRDLRGAEGHLQLARRAGAGFRGDAGERDPHLRGEVRHYVPARGRRISARRGCTTCRLLMQNAAPESRSLRPDPERWRSRVADQASGSQSPIAAEQPIPNAIPRS